MQISIIIVAATIVFFKNASFIIKRDLKRNRLKRFNVNKFYFYISAQYRNGTTSLKLIPLSFVTTPFVRFGQSLHIINVWVAWSWRERMDGGQDQMANAKLNLLLLWCLLMTMIFNWIDIHHLNIQNYLKVTIMNNVGADARNRTTPTTRDIWTTSV